MLVPSPPNRYSERQSSFQTHLDSTHTSHECGALSYGTSWSAVVCMTPAAACELLPSIEVFPVLTRSEQPMRRKDCARPLMIRHSKPPLGCLRAVIPSYLDGLTAHLSTAFSIRTFSTFSSRAGLFSYTHTRLKSNITSLVLPRLLRERITGAEVRRSRGPLNQPCSLQRDGKVSPLRRASRQFWRAVCPAQLASVAMGLQRILEFGRRAHCVHRTDRLSSRSRGVSERYLRTVGHRRSVYSVLFETQPTSHREHSAQTACVYRALIHYKLAVKAREDSLGLLGSAMPIKAGGESLRVYMLQGVTASP